jgi:IclR family pca regulon transcriptional regulator
VTEASRTGDSAVTSVQSLERGLAVIRAFDADHGRMTLSEVARQAELSRAAARRFLHTLVGLGYMQTDGREFWLRPKILELGYAYLSSMSLPEIATPHLRDLSDKIHESSSLSVLDGTEIVYVARIPARRIMAVAINVGTHFPAYATSMGRVLLAGLPDMKRREVLDATNMRPLTPATIVDRDRLETELEHIREEGYALVDQELEPGLRSIAVGVTNRAGEVVAALNVSVPSTQVSIEQMRDELLPALRAARDAIEHDLHALFPSGA